MSDPSSTALTPVPGQSAPLAVLTPSDHSAILLITASIGLVFALISLLIRYFVRMEFRHSFAPDDVLATIAMVFAVLQAITVFVACHDGFGKTIADVSASGLVGLQKATYAGDILYIITIYITKASIAALFLRLSPIRNHRRMSHLVLFISSLLAFISIFLIALKCNFSHPWLYIGETCTGLLARWDVVAAFDISTEVFLFATSIYLVKDLQLSFSKKAVVIGAFAFRLPVIAPIGFRLHYLAFNIKSTDPTMAGVLVQVMTQVEISFAIIAATIPCLRPFMTALSTNYGAPAEMTKSSSPYGGLKYSLNSLSNQSRRSRTRARAQQSTDLKTGTATGAKEGRSFSQPTQDAEPAVNSGKSEGKRVAKFRWDLPRYDQRTTIVGRGDGHSMESHESKQMIIERNTEWVVEYEDKDSNGEGYSDRALSSAGGGERLSGVGGGQTFFKGVSEEDVGRVAHGGV